MMWTLYEFILGVGVLLYLPENKGNSGDDTDFQMSGRLAVVTDGCPNASQ